jgi:hypothetical protein
LSFGSETSQTLRTVPAALAFAPVSVPPVAVTLPPTEGCAPVDLDELHAEAMSATAAAADVTAMSLRFTPFSLVVKMCLDDPPTDHAPRQP